MAENSAIEWTDHTFNPWIGCAHVGPGCDHCYAEALMDKRHGRARWGGPGKGVGTRVRTAPSSWAKPLKWQRDAGRFLLEHCRRQRVFCASLADVFDNAAPDEWRWDLARLIEATPSLDWLLLTKRIGNARAMLEAMFGDAVPANVWLGATVVNQAEADRDAPKLIATKRALRISIAFLSCEPLLGPIDLTSDGLACLPCPNAADGLSMDPSTGAYECCPQCDFTGIGDEWGIDWVIVGGENGAGARPMHPDWARSLRDQCAAEGVPFLFKQWGEWAPTVRATMKGDTTVWLDGTIGGAIGGANAHGRGREMNRVGKKAAGRLLDGVEHNGFPEVRHAR